MYHLDVGVVIPRLLNIDGSYQGGCRKTYPLYFILFNRMGMVFPKNDSFGYINEDVTSEIGVASGVCMLIRKSTVEDVNHSYGITKKGWKIYYVVESAVVHYHHQGVKQRNRFWVLEKSLTEDYYFFEKNYSLRAANIYKISALINSILNILYFQAKSLLSKYKERKVYLEKLKEYEEIVRWALSYPRYESISRLKNQERY